MTKRNPIISVIKDILYYGLETFGRYYSCYRGLVVDNEDPLGLQRLQLIIPEISQGQVYKFWAHAKGVFSGTGFGSQVIPPKGELVWVEFERGHPEVPIWNHGHFGNGEFPTDDIDLANVNCYWFKTPYGHKVKLDDTKKTITISTPNASITLNSDGRFSIKNGSTDIATLLNDILTTYMKTTTVSGDLLNPDSIKSAIQNIKEVNQLFS